MTMGQAKEQFVGMTYDELLEENAKLRKLCSDMFTDFANCDYELRRHGKTFLAVTRYFDRMQELGVEVKP